MSLADLRGTEYGYLDENHHVYLDHTGAGLPARSQIRASAERLSGDCFGNPHSENPTSRASEHLVTSARAAVLRHFDADPSEYVAIFTANATGAIRLVGEAFPFDRRTRLVLPADNHNSVNGLREYARAAGARTVLVPLGPQLSVDEAALDDALTPARGRRHLLAYPAQSNFSGVQHSLEWIARAQQRGYDVLLDAAAFVPTNRLDLSVVHPDFVAISWYKVFGYPTGLGCLLARREALARLQRPWFSGGTIQVASAQEPWHKMADDEAAFEDGTLNFLGIPDIEVGLDHIRAVGVDAIHEHVVGLTGQLLAGLRTFEHSGGRPLVRFLGPRDTDRRGGTVALNLLDPQGQVIDERIISHDAAERRISLRTGCFCNPGAGEAAFSITRSMLRGAVRRTTGTIDNFLNELGLPTGGAVRVSLGLASNSADVEAFLAFVSESYLDRTLETVELSPRVHC